MLLQFGVVLCDCIPKSNRRTNERSIAITFYDTVKIRKGSRERKKTGRGQYLAYWSGRCRAAAKDPSLPSRTRDVSSAYCTNLCT